MSNLSIDLHNHIDEFYCLKDKNYNFKILSKAHCNYKLKSCKIYKYKNLCACSVHDIQDKIDAIKTLINTSKRKNVSTIHFCNINSLNYAKRYLRDFGKISHYCCEGKGVMFLDVSDCASAITCYET